MVDIRHILNNSEIVFETAIAVSFKDPSILFLFRNNGEEVEIDNKNQYVTHQLTFSELRFFDDNYPFVNISNFKVRKKIYN